MVPRNTTVVVVGDSDREQWLVGFGVIQPLDLPYTRSPQQQYTGRRIASPNHAVRLLCLAAFEHCESSTPHPPPAYHKAFYDRGSTLRSLEAPRLTLLEPQSRSGDKPVKFQVVLSPNGTAVLKGLRSSTLVPIVCTVGPINYGPPE